MNLTALCQTELPTLTSEDFEEVKDYMRSLPDDPGESFPILMREAERLGVNWGDFAETFGQDTRILGAVHFTLLLAERQRDRMLLDTLTADAEELKTI